MGTQWWYLFDRKNDYFKFIEECRLKKYGDEELHTHHIIPKYRFDQTNPEEMAYCEASENLIRLSVADHVRAHALLFEIYGDPRDKAAVLMLQGDKAASRKIWRQQGAKAVHQKLSAEGSNFWNSSFQQELGARSLARPDALEIRSKGGQIGGKNRQKGRVIRTADRYVFSYDGVPVLCIINCETGGEVLEVLNSFKQTKLTRATPLLNGTRQSLHSWSCEKL